MEKEQLRDLLSKYSDGNISLTEFQALRKLVDQTHEEDLHSMLEAIWNNHISRKEINADVKESILQNIQCKIKKPAPVKHKLNWVTIVAATIALLLSSYFIYDNQFRIPEDIAVAVEKGDKSKVILPDGSTVWLNATSQISYNTDFNLKNRTVKLDGEAFFDVKHDENNPFIVNLGQIEVKVLGTQFNVKYYEGEDSIDISLVEGKIDVYDTKKRLLANINPNQKLIYNKTNSKWNVQACDSQLDRLWTDNILKFENASIQEVVIKLERWYGVNINIEPSDKDFRIGLTIKSESLNETLQLIKTMIPIDYTISEEEVYMSFE